MLRRARVTRLRDRVCLRAVTRVTDGIAGPSRLLRLLRAQRRRRRHRLARPTDAAAQQRRLLHRVLLALLQRGHLARR